MKYCFYQEPKWKTRVFVEIVEMLRWFAGKQIRNVAAVGGNIVTGKILYIDTILILHSAYIIVIFGSHNNIYFFLGM